MNRKRVVIGISAGCIAFAGILLLRPRTEAAPSQIIDSTTANAVSYVGHKRVVRTTNGTNGNRVFTVMSDGTNQVINYSDDHESASPTWSSITLKTGNTHRVSDMVWDETNNVIYICYARGSYNNGTTADVFYKRLSNLNGSPSLGAEQTIFNGNTGAATYNDCHIEIAGDSSTTKVVIFTNTGTAGGGSSQMEVRAGTLNSDAPTWTAAHVIKSWTAATASGVFAISRVNTDKLVILYWNGADMMAARHDDSAAINATSGWDALNGTDNSETTISTDDPNTAQVVPGGSVVGAFTSDIVWFGWTDAANDLNTRRWSGSALDREMLPVALSVGTGGPAMSTDGTTLYMVYRGNANSTQLDLVSRPMSEGSLDWNWTVSHLDQTAESVTYPNIARKMSQGKLDIIYTTATNDFVRHVTTYLVSGNAYQESVSSPYEGTTALAECDGVTPNVSVSIAGGSRINTWCDDSTGAFSVATTIPASADSDIVAYIDQDAFLADWLFGHWKMDESSWNGTSNEIVDSSTRLEHGTANGGAQTSATAKFGRSGFFDGTNDFGSFGDHSDHDITLPFTLSAWIYMTQLPSGKGSTATIISKYGAAGNQQYEFSINTSDVLYFWKSHDGTNGEQAFSTGYTFNGSHVNAWQHVAVVGEVDGTMRLYVNGSQVDTGTLSNTTFYAGSTASFRIGANTVTSNYFKGNIDDVRMYWTALNANQISYLYGYDTALGSNVKGAAYTHNTDTQTNITGISLYKNRTIIRSESGTSITNADINSYDQSTDIDIPIASDGTHVVADLGTKITVNTGDTYAPGGNVTTPKLHIKGTYTGGSENLIVYGGGTSSSCDSALSSLRPLCIEGGTFSANSNSTLFSASSDALIQNATYNTLTLNPGANSVTHTLMAGTFTVNGALSMGNGLNSSVTITAAPNSTTLTCNSSLTIASNTAFVANGSNTTTVKGNWTNSGTFTHSSGTVDLAGADSSTQILSGNSTFHNLSASTSTNAAGRTLRFTAGSTQTIAGTWTVAGASGKVLTLESSAGSAWNVNPAAASVDYASVSYSNNTGTAICATHSSDGGNNSGWTFTAGSSCAPPPATSTFSIEGINLEGVSVN